MHSIPAGAISEVFGAVSSGKTLLLHKLLATASAQNEFLAVVDSQDAFDPLSASLTGVDLRRLLWIRAHGHVDHALKAADLILHAGGFGWAAPQQSAGLDGAVQPARGARRRVGVGENGRQTACSRARLGSAF